MALEKINSYSVTKETKEVIEMADELLKELIRNQSDFEMIERLTNDDLDMMKNTLALYKSYKELLILTAKQQDFIVEVLSSVSRRTDIILEKLEELEAK